MNRREFLAFCVAAGTSIGLGGFGGCASTNSALSQADMDELRGLRIADPHAHPYKLHGIREYDSSTPDVELMNKIGMVACAFSAVGDRVTHHARSGFPSCDTRSQLQLVLDLEKRQQIHLILNAADVQALYTPNRSLGALMTIEGGDALEGLLKRIEEFYALGVRMITLVHDYDNEIGFNCRSHSDGPLTSFGIQVVEKMNQMGMLIDVAHAKTKTLKSIVEVSAAPVIDSHTSPLPYGYETSKPSRLRSWPEMEMIAKTGGVICTWPYADARDPRHKRTTMKDWAEEIALMKSRLGIEHCGFGTDSGGALPQMVEGWVSYASLPHLIKAMRETGLSQNDVVAYLGGNFLRVLQRSLG